MVLHPIGKWDASTKIDFFHVPFRCIDGASYMDAVADGINQAQHEIFITDWWLSPEIFMTRPGGADKWRLDLMLKKKAVSVLIGFPPLVAAIHT